MSSSRLRTRLGTTGLLGCATVLASAGFALAASPVKGGAYTGKYSDGAINGISFKVSANGKKVTDLYAETPIHCAGGCGGFSSPSGGTAKISSKGTFKVTLPIKGLGGKTTIGTDTITCTFLKHGKAKGTVSSHFNSGSSSDRKVTWTAID
jgi:hypothetical protein